MLSSDPDAEGASEKSMKWCYCCSSVVASLSFLWLQSGAVSLQPNVFLFA